MNKPLTSIARRQHNLGAADTMSKQISKSTCGSHDVGIHVYGAQLLFGDSTSVAL